VSDPRRLGIDLQVKCCLYFGQTNPTAVPYSCPIFTGTRRTRSVFIRYMRSREKGCDYDNVGSDPPSKFEFRSQQ
jgi:hypothetical protein